MVKRFVLVAGWVHSANDRDRHWISARRLLDLYRLPLSACVLVEDEEQLVRALLGVDRSGLTFLYPSRSGDYSVR